MNAADEKDYELNKIEGITQVDTITLKLKDCVSPTHGGRGILGWGITVDGESYGCREFGMNCWIHGAPTITLTYLSKGTTNARMNATENKVLMYEQTFQPKNLKFDVEPTPKPVVAEPRRSWLKRIVTKGATKITDPMDIKPIRLDDILEQALEMLCYDRTFVREDIADGYRDGIPPNEIAELKNALKRDEELEDAILKYKAGK